MKRPVRENIRKYKVNQQQTKNIQSLSPPQKQLLKKIENIQRDGSNKYEHSMQDNYVRPEQKQESQDFRVEIEKRFQKSTSNKTYAFPFGNNTEDRESDAESSLDSLRHVTVYDLASQNQKKKHMAKGGLNPNVLDREYRSYYAKTEGNESNDGMNQDYADDSDSDTPIEVRIRDKNSSTYRKFIQMLERIPMFSHNSTNSQEKNNYIPQDPNYENLRKDENEVISTYDAGRTYMGQSYQNKAQDLLSNFTTQASTAETYKGQFRDGYSPNERIKAKERDIKSSERRDRNQKKPLSEERPGKVEGGSKHIDYTKMTQDNTKLLYIQNSNVNKTITPQYNPTGASNMKDMFSREGHFKTYTNDGTRVKNYSGIGQSSQASRKNPLENLYQRAQNDLMSNKLRANNNSGGINPITTKSYLAKPSKDSANSNSSLGYSITPLKRDETPKDPARNLAFTNFYGSNSQQPGERFSAINISGVQGKSSQKNSANALQITSPMKKSNESAFYTSYDPTQAQFFKRPAFQLDLTKRSRGHSRETLSSSRNRNKTPDKPLVDGVQNLLMRTSYDTNNNFNNAQLSTSLYKTPVKPSVATTQVTRNSQSAKRSAKK